MMANFSTGKVLSALESGQALQADGANRSGKLSRLMVVTGNLEGIGSNHEDVIFRLGICRKAS